MNPAIKTAINIVGSQKKLGDACEVSQQAVYKWLHNKAKVLAHIRLAGLCGTGIKPPDLIATIACSACHDEIDRRTNFVNAGYAKECALEGMARTQVIWLKEGVIKA